MDWIHSTTLADCARIPANAGPLALYIWTQSGGAPYDPEAPRWPVYLGTAAEVGKLLGVSTPTARRALSELRAWCHELRPGQWTPRLGVWTDLDAGHTDQQGRPLYVRIDRRAVLRLVGLSRGAHPQRARKAFQLAAMALPRLRSAAHAGRRSISLTNGQITQEIATSRSTIAPAVELLEAAELVAQVGRGHRRLSALSGLLCEIPKVRRGGDQSSTGGVIRSVPPILREQDHTNAPHHRAPAREDEGGGGSLTSISVIEKLKTATWADGSPVLPGLGDRGARLLASHCKRPEDVEAWIESEVMNLSDPSTANPSGLLVYLSKEEGSRPGTSSTSEQARRAKAAKADRSGWQEPHHARRFHRLYRGETMAERLKAQREECPPDLEEMAAHAAEFERIQASHSDKVRELRAAEPPPPRVRAPAPRSSREDRQRNRSKMSDLLARLQETTT